MGALGHERVFLVRPRGVDLKVPSDLNGFNFIDYKLTGADPDVDAACEELRRAIRDGKPK